jgi:hypothetical protein
MRQREWIAVWIADLLQFFTGNDEGLCTAVQALLHNRDVRTKLKRMFIYFT